MSKLIGLAFTSPGLLATVIIDRETYNPFYYENDYTTLEDFRIFLQSKDERIPIVITSNVRDLKELQSISNNKIESFILFEDPAILTQIEGINLPDLQGDAVLGWSKKIITQEQFNELLKNTNKETFTITDKALTVSNTMTQAITFKEVVLTLENEFNKINQNPKEFIDLACKYVTKLINKKTWVAKARKSAISLGIDVKIWAELEKLIETDKNSDEIWRAIYDFTENNSPLEKVLISYTAPKDDLEFIVTKLGLKQGDKLEFTASPNVIKKRKTKAKVA